MKLMITIEEMGDYIGIDIDNSNFFRMLKTYFNSAKFGIVTVEQNEESGAFHIKIWGKFTPEEMLQIRRLLGDDKKRLEMDERKLELSRGFGEKFLHWTFNTLFDMKMVEGHLVKYIKINPLSKPFFDPKDTEKRRSVR